MQINFSVEMYLIQSWIGYIVLSMSSVINATVIYVIENKIIKLKEQ